MRKKYLHLAVSIVIIAVSLFIAFHGVSLSQLSGALGNAKYLYLIPALLMVAISYLLRAWRWRYLVRVVKDVKTTRLFAPLMIGFMANMLPARAGEFIRAYLLSKKEQISFSASFATIFIERLFDLLIVLLMLVGILFSIPGAFSQGNDHDSFQLADKVWWFGTVSLAACLLIFVFSALLQFKNDWALGVVRIFSGPLPVKWREKIFHLLQSFNDGLRIMRDGRGFLAAVGLSVLIWVSFVITYYPLYFAFGIENKLPLISLPVLCLVVAIFITIAPTPGFVGSYHLGCVAALHGIFGIPKAIALSYGIVAWVVAMGSTVVIGALFALKEHVSFSRLPVHGSEKKRNF